MEKCTLEKEGFLADYYPGTKSPETAVIAVGGASCDEKISNAMYQYLRDAGYNVLVLGYYLWEGLSKDLIQIPIDYAEKAVHWLKDEKHIKKIAMTGASAGAGYTLLAASFIPDITCIIPVVPWDYVCEGNKQTRKGYVLSGHSQYSWHGKDVPCFHLKMPWSMFGWLRAARKTPGYGMSRFMRFGYDYMEEHLDQNARIRVENMHGDVLLLAAKDDDCWPSDVAVPRIVSVLKEHDYPYRVESHVYEKASHALVDGLDSMSGFAKWAVKHMIPAEKKYPKECEEARRDSFRRILKFIDEWDKEEVSGAAEQ